MLLNPLRILASTVGGNTLNMKQVVFILIVLLLFGCINHQNNNVNNDYDTLILLRINNHIENFHIKRKANTDFKEFQHLIDKYGKNLFYSNKALFDITGEGKDNICESEIRQYNDGFLLKNTISKNDTLIWTDSIVINDNQSYWFQCDTLYFKLKPYSLFYVGYLIVKYTFIYDKIDSTSYIYNDFISNLKYNNDEDTLYWKDYLYNFKGRVIYKLSPSDPDSYIWDKRQRKFILIHSP